LAKGEPESYPLIGVSESKVDHRSSILEKLRVICLIVRKNSLSTFSVKVITVIKIAKSPNVLPVLLMIDVAI
jgi:hypothetical protein